MQCTWQYLPATRGTENDGVVGSLCAIDMYALFNISVFNLRPSKSELTPSRSAREGIASCKSPPVEGMTLTQQGEWTASMLALYVNQANVKSRYFSSPYANSPLVGVIIPFSSGKSAEAYAFVAWTTFPAVMLPLEVLTTQEASDSEDSVTESAGVWV